MTAPQAAAAVVELARELIAVDTANPPGGEGRLLPLVLDRLRRHGAADPVVVEPAAGRTSAIVTLPAPGGPVVALNAHLDTAATADSAWTRDPLAGEVVDGRLYGRGAADMKGGLACLLHAVDRLYAQRPRPAVTLRFELVADEERGSLAGAATLAHSGLLGPADVCVIAEPTALAVACAEYGVAWLTIRLRATAPPVRRQGGSVVGALATTLDAFDGAVFDSGGHDLPPVGCNVGAAVIDGLPNQVPAEARLRLDVRLRPGDRAADMVAWARARLGQALTGLPGVAGDVTIDKYAAGTATDPDRPLVRAFAGAARRVLAGPVADRTMGGPTDARYHRAAGVPVVVFGPGDPAVAHRPDEHVPVGALTAAAAVFEAFLLEVADGSAA